MTKGVGHKVVLVVDDEVFARLLAVQMFLDQGYIVLEANNADEAIDVLDRNDDVGLLLTDITMPGELDGLDLIRHVQRERPQIRCIATSGRTFPSHGSLLSGGRFLAKPYTAHALMDLVRQIDDGGVPATSQAA